MQSNTKLECTKSEENGEWNANQDRMNNILKIEGDEYGIRQGTTPI